MRHLAVVAALVIGTTAPPASAQPATITGKIIADDSGRPLVNARVEATTAARGSAVVLTDGDGRFSLSVQSPPLRVAASKTGYGARELTAAELREPIEIHLARGAAISGRVVDEFGDSLAFARVVAEAPSAAQNPTTVAATTTDDRGEYRMASLAAGTLVVAVVRVNAQSTDRPGPVKTYYPGAATAKEAQELRLAPGEDRPRIDFVVPADPLPVPPVVQMRERLQPGSTQPPPTARGVLRGRITTAGGLPVPRAVVGLLPVTNVLQSRTVRTDADGRYEFRDLTADTFRIFANKPGYSRSAPAVNASPIELGDGETRDAPDIRLDRWGTVEGRIIDELGEPLQGVAVQLLEVRYERGRRRLAPAGVSSRVTDDLGRYRIYSVSPGRYIVSAAVGAVQSADLPGYDRAYYPGTTNPGAAQFVTAGASDVTGIDFALSRTRTARVVGKLLDSAGNPTSTGSLMLVPSRQSSSVTNVPVGARIQNGAFEFPNVAPGQYIIRADRGRSNKWTEGEFGMLPVAVDGADVTGLVLQTSRGSSIKGRVSFSVFNGTKTPEPASIEIVPVPVDADRATATPATADIRSDWTFEIANVSGPRRLQVVRAPASWTLRELRVNGIDATDRPLSFGEANQSLTDVEVVMTDRLNEVTGVVSDERGRPAGAIAVLMFPAERDRRYSASRFLRRQTTAPEGTFAIVGMPPGSYYVAAVAQLPTEGDEAWQESEYLDTLVRAAESINLGEGQKVSVRLRPASR